MLEADPTDRTAARGGILLAAWQETLRQTGLLFVDTDRVYRSAAQAPDIQTLRDNSHTLFQAVLGVVW